MKFVKTVANQVVDTKTVMITSMDVIIENDVLVITATNGVPMVSATILTTESDDLNDLIHMSKILSTLHSSSIIEYDTKTKLVSIYNLNTVYEKVDLGNLKIYYNGDASLNQLFLNNMF